MISTPATPSAEVDPTGERILRAATFDPRLKTYWLLLTLLTLVITVVGIPIALIWAVVGRGIHQRQYDALECELTERTLNVRKGFLFRVQKNVPLDKITDLALNEGPILRYLGLCALNVETAGGGAGTATGQAVLIGIEDALEFRNAVMRQRDRVTAGGSVSGPTPDPKTEGGESTLDVLADIRSSLQRIEAEVAAARRDSGGA